MGNFPPKIQMFQHNFFYRLPEHDVEFLIINLGLVCILCIFSCFLAKKSAFLSFGGFSYYMNMGVVTNKFYQMVSRLTLIIGRSL